MTNNSKDIIKRKNDLFRSIMKNPKLSRTFKEGLKAPIGSTKREQAKSIFSIIRKVGGVHDGQGGPTSSMINTPQTTDNSVFNPTSYENMMIFPAAPKLKNSYGLTVSPVTNTTSGSFTTSNTGNTKNLTTQNNNIGTNLFTTKTPDYSNLFSTKGYNTQTETKPKSLTTKEIQQIVGATADGVVGPETLAAIKKYQLNNGLTVDGIVGPETLAKMNASGQKTSTISPASKYPNLTLQNVDTSGKKKSGLIDSFTPITIPTSNTSSATTQQPTDQKQFDWSKVSTEIPTMVKAPEEESTTSTDTNISGGNTSAVSNVSSVAGITDPSVLLKDAVSQVGLDKIINGIIRNEGKSISGVYNNPGNIKFNNLPGQIDSGVSNDGGKSTFASYSTEEDGRNAIGNLITAAINGGTSYGTNPTFQDFINRYTGQGTSTTSTEDIETRVSNAIASNTGAQLFASGITEEKFGGNLSQYIEKIDKDLRTEYNLDELENELSDITSKKENFLPTLRNYIGGRDQYLKKINKMIDRYEEKVDEYDMSDPQTAKDYENYLNYLYTLKGKQTQRYTNYLNSSISDYNADVAKLENNYNTIYKRFETARTSKVDIAKEDYENLYNSMVGLYTSLEEAPTKFANLKILNDQAGITTIDAFGNAIGGTTNTDPDFLKKKKTYYDDLTDKDGGLDLTKISSGGLAEWFSQIENSQGNLEAGRVALDSLMSKSLANTTSEEDKIKLVGTYKELITDLANSGDYGKQLADELSASLGQTSYDSFHTYITKNIKNIESALKELLQGKGRWLAKDIPSGLVDKESWEKRYSNLDKTFLDSLYNIVYNATQAGTSADKILTIMINGTTDEEKSANFTTNFISSW